MNSNLYRLIFDKRKGKLVPVAEHVTVCGKSGGEGLSSSGLGGVLSRRLCSLASFGWRCYLLGLLSASSYAVDLPRGGVVSSGEATLSYSEEKLTIDQGSSKVSLNWESFGIGPGREVEFRQPSSSAIALNRVLGGSRSEIYGSLKSNGQVFLLNDRGVLFGRDSEVLVGGLLATTAELSDDDFNLGRYVFRGTGSSGLVSQGLIRVSEGGSLALVGSRVLNEGRLQARGGRVHLASGSDFELSLDSAGLYQVSVTSAAAQGLLEQGGLISSEGGEVYLTARGRDLLQDQVMNLSGVIEARSIEGSSSRVVIDGGSSGDVLLSSARIDVSGEGVSGGSLSVTGHRLLLTSGTRLTADGVSGGLIRVGGDYLGRGSLARSSGVYIDSSSVLTADAGLEGAGGRVIVWSDDRTQVDGTIRARGGLVSGDGGFVETSSQRVLGVRGSVRVDARGSGKGGNWLLDPTDVFISTSGESGFTQPTTGTFDWSGSTATILNTTIESALNQGTSVTITTASSSTGTGNINIEANIAKTSGGDATLTMTAKEQIIMGSGVNITSTSGALNLDWTTGSDTAATGAFVMKGDTNISLNGGNMTLNVTRQAGQAARNTGGIHKSQASTNNFTANTITFNVNMGANSYHGFNHTGTTIFNATGGTTLNLNYAAGILRGLDVRENSILEFTGGGSNTINTRGGRNYALSLRNNSTIRTTAGTTLLIDARFNNATTTSQALYLGTGTAHLHGDITLNLTSDNGRSYSHASSRVFNTSGNITFNGNSRVGMVVGGGWSHSGGKLTLNMTTTRGTALIWRANSMNLTSDVEMIGNTTSAGHGIYIDGNLNSTANLIFTGTATSARGFFVAANRAISATGNITATGTSETGEGVRTDAGVSMTASGNVTVTGTSDRISGIHILGTTTMNGDNVLLTGSSESSFGVRIVGLTDGGVASNSFVINATRTSEDTTSVLIDTINMTATGIRVNANNMTNIVFTGSRSISATNIVLDATRSLDLKGVTATASAGTLTAISGRDLAVGDLSKGFVYANETSSLNATGGINIFTASYDTNLTNLGAFQPVSRIGGVLATAATTEKWYNANSTNTANTTANRLNIMYRDELIINLTHTVQDKVYDGTNTMTGSANITSTAFDNNTYSLTGSPTYTVSSPRAGTDLAASVVMNASDVTVTATDAAVVRGHILSSGTDIGTANITPKAVTVTLSDVTKEYDGTDAATITWRSADFLNGESLDGITGKFNTTHAGTGLTVTGDSSAATIVGSTVGSVLSDYAITYVDSVNSSITPKAVTVTLSDVTKEYDGTNAAGITAAGTGLLGNETLTGIVGVFNTSNAGTGLTVTRTGDATGISGSTVGSLASDYIVTYTDNSTTGNITPRVVEIAADGVSKKEDGNANTVNLTISAKNLVEGDDLKLSYDTAVYDSPLIGSGKDIILSGVAMSGASAANYILSGPSQTLVGQGRITSLVPIYDAFINAIADAFGSSDGSESAAVIVDNAKGLDYQFEIDADRRMHSRSSLEVSIDKNAIADEKTLAFQENQSYRGLRVLCSNTGMIKMPVSLPNKRSGWCGL